MMRYILHYTQPGDIVFDGFAGTGMTGVAAQACGNPSADQREKINKEWTEVFHDAPKWGTRHAICGDLSPYASLIAYNYNTPVNASLLKKEVKRIFEEVKAECSWMYETKHEGKDAVINFVVWSDMCVCENCGKEFSYWETSLDRENKCMKDDVTCPHCNTIHSKKNLHKSFETKYDPFLDEVVSEAKSVPAIIVGTTKEGVRFERAVGQDDYQLVERIEKLSQKYFCPTAKLPHGFNLDQPQNSHKIYHFHQFYTKRNLHVLACLFEKIQTSKLPNKIKFIFTGMINRSSKMNRVHVSHYFNGGGGWNGGNLKGTLYVPSAPIETSILDQVEDKLNGYLRLISFLPEEYVNALYVSSADSTSLANNSVDYIFVDPPFGANIMYSELNTLPEAWLKVNTNNSSEAIVNEKQGKNQVFYLDEMSKCFKEFFRILKPGKWITIEFSNTSASVWNTIQTAIVQAGFVVANVSALDKKQGSFKAVTTTTAVKQDLVITCFKPTDELLKKFKASSDVKQNVWDFIDEYLAHLPVHIEKRNATTTVIERNPKILYDRLISYYVQRGYPVPLDAANFQCGLRERYLEIDGMFFTALQAAEYDTKKKLAPDFIPMGIIISDEANGIQWLKNQLRDGAKSYQELHPEWMQAINSVRKHDIIPELKQILEENFIEEEGKWRLPNIQDDKDVAAIHIKALLSEFKRYVQTALTPKGKIKEARVEALRTGFKQCYIDKDFETIVTVGNKIPQNLLTEDEVLLQFYDIATSRI